MTKHGNGTLFECYELELDWNFGDSVMLSVVEWNYSVRIWNMNIVAIMKVACESGTVSMLDETLLYHLSIFHY